MNLFERMAYELLKEETPSERFNSLGLDQRQEIKQIKKDLEFYFDQQGLWRHDKDGNIKKNSGKGEDYRIEVHNKPVDATSIDLALKNIGNHYGIKTITIPKNEPGSKSGTFPTILITSPLGSKIYIVLSGFGRGSVSKQFTPTRFKIEDKLYIYKDLYRELKQKIQSSDYEINIKKYLLYLLETVMFNRILKNGNLLKIKKEQYDDTNVLKIDRTNILSDFGEILSAIAIARYEQDSIYFPKSATEPLIDFEVGSTRYSAKSVSGAAPTLTSMIGYYDYIKDELDAPQKEKDILLKILDSIKGNIGVEQTYLATTKLISQETWQSTLNLLEIDDLIIDDSKKSLKIIRDKLDEYYYDDDKNLLKNKLLTFYDEIGTKITTPIERYDPNNRLRHGYVIAALSYKIPKILNENKFNILDNMKEIINQIDGIKQVNLVSNKDEFEFKITNLDRNVTIKFVGGGSVADPNKQNLRFKIS